MIRFLAFTLMLSTLSASTLTFAEADAELIIPDDWTIISKNDRLNATPPESLQDRYSNRRLHFTWASVNAKTLEDAIESEIDRITERAPKQGSSNDRSHFIGAVPVKTKQGLPGLRADFAVKQSEERLHYPVIKYYFHCPNGKILKVCAHVYGEKELFDSFNSIILQGITINNAAEQDAAANP